MNKIKSLIGFRNVNTYEGSDFQKSYEKLLSSNKPKDFEEEEKLKLLKWAIIFFNQSSDDVRKLGYRILIRYSNLFGDYRPLYDVSLNAGFIPVAKFLEDRIFGEERIGSTFANTFFSSYLENFKQKIHDRELFLSLGQRKLVDFNNHVQSDSLIVAPTSYGKSEMMMSKVVQYSDKKISIVVPTKSLLAQTKARLLEHEDIVSSYNRIITHPEMYKGDETKFLSVLTQERLLRLIEKNDDFSLDLLMVDEAHNLIEEGYRAELLLQVIIILKNRNPDIKIHFFTPFLLSAKSLETKYSNYNLKEARSDEFIKVQKYYLYNYRENKELTLYDQFLNRHISIGYLDCNDFEFIDRNKANKNIVYANKPRDVEDIAIKLMPTCPDVDLSAGYGGQFSRAYKAISDYLDPEYNLLKCLTKGVVYHHGRMPEMIRLYVEYLFSKHQDFRYIVTTSTLLEGVNIPAEKLFLMSVKKGTRHLSKSSFKNLTGRICRFKEIFSSDGGNLGMLEPEIFVVNGNYAPSVFNPHKFFENKAKITPKDRDDVENVLLKEPENEEERKEEVRALEYLENIEPGSIAEQDRKGIRYVDSAIGKAAYKNNVNEFDIYKNETLLISQYEKIAKKGLIKNIPTLIGAIVEVFIEVIDRQEDTEKRFHYDLTRLKNQSAQKFYALFLEWRAGGSSYKKMIGSYLWYWKEREKAGESKVYVGNAWGEIKREEADWVERYVNIKRKTKAQRVNLAILRIKEEQDFVEFKLLKFIEIFYDLNLIDEGLYEKIKYGSSDKKVICMLKNGISIELAKLLNDRKYLKHITFDLAKDALNFDKEIIEVMREYEENEILIFELMFHTRNTAEA